MSCFRFAIASLFASVIMTPTVAFTADDAKPKAQCILNAFAAKLGLTAEQKVDIEKAQADFEKKSAPVCETMFKLHIEHHQAVLQTLSPEQKAELPAIMKAEREKMLQHFATKLELTEEQKKKAQNLCDVYTAKYKELAEQEESKRAGQFQIVKNQQFEAFCEILTDDQRVKLPALIQEEMQAGRTPSAKSEFRKAMNDKLNLTDTQKEQLDKVCDEFAKKIDDQKALIRGLCKEKHIAMEKVLTDTQKVKFQEYVKTAAD